MRFIDSRTFVAAVLAALVLWPAVPAGAQTVIRKTPSTPGAGGGSIRPTPRTAESDRRLVRRDREEPSERAVTVRRISRPGTVISRLPERHRRVIVGGRTYYQDDDDNFFAELRIGGGGVSFLLTRPPSGSYVTYLPEQYERVIVSGRRYYTCDDVYYERRIVNGRGQYIVVDPPIGATIVTLPDAHTSVIVGGKRYIRHGDCYYQPYLHGGRLAYVRVESPAPRYASVSGTVVYDRAYSVPRGAEAVVRLLRVRGGETVVVSERTVTTYGESTIPFEFAYDEDEYYADAEYVVDAQVVHQGRAIYTTPAPVRYERGRSGFELTLRAAF